MKSGILPIVLLVESAAAASIIPDVRSALARQDFQTAERHIQNYRASKGITPEMLEAHSWLGRGALAAGQFDKALSYAAETHKLALDQLKKQRLDAEKHLPIALGAAIEVQAQVMAARNQRSEAVAFLQGELRTYHATSIRTRIQKNINLLSLEGKPAPALELKEYLGPRPQPFAALKGRPLILFFWAHWCSDCKYQAPVLARLAAQYREKGLLVVGPTQRYGYAARGQEATPEEELKYIDAVRQKHYAALPDMPVPVSEENFRNYGSSSSPTLVLVDRQGIVRLYHPGRMSYEELAPKVEALVAVPEPGRTPRTTQLRSEAAVAGD